MRLISLLIAAATGAALAVLAHGPATRSAAAAVPDNEVRIGVLTDMTGFASDSTGIGSVVAAQLAAEDAAGLLGGMKVDVVQADHQNKPDVGSAIAKQWLENGRVDAIADVPFSSVALAVNEVVRANPKAVFLASGPGTADLTGPKCAPNTIHWTYDTWSLANGTAKAVVQNGGDTWFFVTADYAFGHALERDAMTVVKAMNGTVLGSVRHPPNASDFSSFMLQAQASKAKIIGLANAVGDTINSVKQAAEFGIPKGGQTLAALLMQITDVHSIGLEAAQGLYLTEAFYWDMNDGTRAFADRFAKRTGGKRPGMIQAGVYASVLHYLKAVKAADTTDGTAVAAKMKAMPTDDPLFGHGSIRADGRHIHDMYLFQVKAPAESKGPWDYYRTVQTIPAAEAFRPLAQGGCPLVKG
ncbi:MAG TPA: ABC transporter substrate-binding protein [Stellaceae bacterium]|jgi:branched-chain amino acid transport system substrate-binding protein